MSAAVERQPNPVGGGAYWVLAALLAASIEPILVKLGFRGAASPWHLLVIKNLVGLAVALPLTRTAPSPTTRDLPRIARASVLLLLTNALSLLALTRIPAVTQITIVSTTPAAVAVVSMLRGRVQPTRRFWAALALSTAGVVLSVGVLDRGLRDLDALGVALAFGAVLSSTAYRSALETLTRTLAPMTVSLGAFAINAALAMVFIAPWMGPVPPAALGVGLWLGVAAAVANVAFVQALGCLGAARISVFTLLQRPLVMVFAALALHESMSAGRWVGAAMVLAGVWAAQSPDALRVKAEAR